MLHRSTIAGPLDLSGCQLWLDAHDSASITQSSGLVSQWNDRSGNARHATAAGSNRPTYSATGLNSRPTLSFDGSANVMTSAYVLPANLTSFVVALRRTQTTGGTILRILVANSSTTSGPIPMSTVREDVSPSDIANASWLGSDLPGPASGTFTSTPTILSGTLSVATTTTNFWSAGGSNFTTSAPGGTPAAAAGGETTCIGGQPGFLARCFNGNISEIILFNRVLAADERRRVEWYLALKWGISVV